MLNGTPRNTSAERWYSWQLSFPSATKNSFIASKYVREIARWGGDVSSMVPETAIKRLKDKYES